MSVKVKISSEERLEQVAAELIHVLANLRKFTKLWEATHGVQLKERKKFYEERADELIKTLQVPEHRNPDQIKVVINTNDTIKD